MRYLRSTFILIALLAVGFLITYSSHATAFDPLPDTRQGICTAESSSSPACQPQSGNPFTGENGVLIKSARLLSIAIGVISVVIIMYAGWQYINSRGDPQKVNSAKNTILYAFVGLAVAVMSQTIITYSLNHIIK